MGPLFAELLHSFIFLKVAMTVVPPEMDETFSGLQI
jgi:hypothetical protein